jgi:hypothetical protein
LTLTLCGLFWFDPADAFALPEWFAPCAFALPLPFAPLPAPFAPLPCVEALPLGAWPGGVDAPFDWLFELPFAVPFPFAEPFAPAALLALPLPPCGDDGVCGDDVCGAGSGVGVGADGVSVVWAEGDDVPA